MFEARLIASGTLKKVLDSIKDLLNEATFDCSDAGIQVSLRFSINCEISHSANNKILINLVIFPPKFSTSAKTNDNSCKRWTTRTSHSSRSTFAPMASTSIAAIVISRWA